MSHPIFSIIVPVYNAEDTIVHTIEVLKNLAFEEYEVILVNDGSTDKTEQLIQSAIQGDSHFQLFTTENQGPGLARNEGIKQSTGKYVLFFDADDEPVKEILADYRQLFEQYPEADLLISSFIFRTLSRGKIISEKDYLVPEYQYTNHEQFMDDMYQLMNQQLMYVVWNKCYKRELLMEKQILFKNYSSCEDRIFNLNYYEHCQQVILNPKIEYIYDFEGGKGITNKYNPNKFKTFEEFYLLANEVTKNANKSGMASLLLKGVTSVILSIVETNQLSNREKKRAIKNILNNPVIREASSIACT
ncbi:glycosyltransferase family 2 protein, partial [Enterococcus faecium]|nr:glycosyltransferase family 2 protein [Enterococcus faecium]